MNGIGGNCRMMSIGGSVLGGIVLWILLALGERGWFSSLLIAALLAGATALLLLALVCRDEVDVEETVPAAPAKAEPKLEQTASVKPTDTPEPDPATSLADTGGRDAGSQPSKAEAETSDAERINDTAVLGGNGDTGGADTDPDAADDDLGEEVARTQALDRTVTRDETLSPDMPDGVAADLREKPALLDAPRGEADDLKRLRGVGPKLEEQLNRLGVWHLSQIAAWSDGEAAWIDDHLEGFKGRVLRDDWIGQAKELTDTV
ncbi:hypothetical protein [uncultured Limimaricola sp.]|uniref:hypothetical protein n=1 Tax=uncultured Limimaricola sp. TaxID=2211667 RepID=UPI0030F762D8